MAKRVFIIHGWGGSPDSNWLPWLKQKLEERNIEVQTPAMPNTDHPKQAEWLGHLEDVVGTTDTETYFIGHSLGCITILRYLETLKEGLHIGGAILVAGFTDDLGITEISDFFKTSINWQSINSHCDNFVVINSDDDHYVDLKYNKILQKELNAKALVQPKMGHFNMAELHVVLNEILKMTA